MHKTIVDVSSNYKLAYILVTTTVGLILLTGTKYIKLFKSIP